MKKSIFLFNYIQASKLLALHKNKELLPNSQELSPQYLKLAVRKFLHHRNLNNSLYLYLKSDLLKIEELKGAK